MKNINCLSLRCFMFLIVFSFGTYAVAQNKKDKSTPATNKKPALAKPENKTESKPEVKTETPKTGTLESHGKEIQKIIKNENGVIRGYDFGTTKQKIKETEDAKYVADGKDFIIYHIAIDEKENAEIIYYLDENELVKGFGIAFLVNPTIMTENVEATLIDDFQNYFNERYGKFSVNSKNDEVWTSKDGVYTVEMGDSSEDESMLEIEIEIFKK